MTILVVSTVHRADDPRIREKLIPSLAPLGPIVYAARPPAPERTDDLRWIPLRGGRLRRNLRAALLCLGGNLRAVSLHDPELLPAGLLARAVRGTPVVFDLHEDVPAQILTTKDWLPPPLRRPLSGLAAGMLRVAERWLVVTLAEEAYRRLFRGNPPVVPNYPVPGSLPGPGADRGYLVYAGDITEFRGTLMSVRAVAGMGERPTLRMVGRSWEPFRTRLRAEAVRLGVDLELTGLLSYREAMEEVAGARVALSPLPDLPNYRHSLPTKVIEYLALGVPVVASDLPGTTRVVGGLPGVRLVPPGAEEAWTEALEEVWGDPALREEAAENAPRVRERFAWPTEEVRRLYGAVMAGRDFSS